VSDDYSQSGEQAVILECASDLPVVGRFLDIGAGDGETFSNTRALALMGWGGVCVEPAAWAFSKLIDLYQDRSDVHLCQALVTADHAGLLTFLYSKDDHLSTVEETEARKWGGVDFRVLTAAAVRLETLLDWFELGASVVSIDAEGRTNELVKAYMRHPAWEQVQVICFEREDFASPGALALAPPFELVAKTPNNVIYRRRS